jgi:phage host-nuclease inhibitor protein Gam
MARMTATESALGSYGDVDAALKRIKLEELKLEDAKARYEKEATQLKTAYEKEAKKRQASIKRDASDIASFCEQHKADFDEPRSREMTWGRIGFRKSKKVILKRGVDYVEKLKAAGLFSCVKTSEAIIRDQVARLDADTLRELGVGITVSDEFFLETRADGGVAEVL